MSEGWMKLLGLVIGGIGIMVGYQLGYSELRNGCSRYDLFQNFSCEGQGRNELLVRGAVELMEGIMLFVFKDE